MLKIFEFNINKNGMTFFFYILFSTVSIFIVLFLQDWEGAVSVTDIGNHLSQTFGGQLKESKPQKQGDPPLYIVTVKNSNNIDLLQEKAEKYLRESLRNQKS